MKAAALLLLAALAWPAHADRIARQGDSWVRVTALPCRTPAVVDAITAEGADPADFRAAAAHVGGQDFAGCWRPDFERREAVLIYEDGDGGLVPFSDLKQVPEA